MDDTSRTRPAAVLTGHFDENAGAILYGAVLAAAAMTVVSVQPDRTGAIALSVVLMLVVYSLAHLYATVLGSRISRPGDRAWTRVRANLRHEAAVVEGGCPSCCASPVCGSRAWPTPHWPRPGSRSP